MVKRSARRGIDLLGGMFGPTARQRIGRWQAARRLVDWSRKGQSAPPQPPAVEPAEVGPDERVRIELMGERPSYRYKLEELKRRHGALGSAFGIKDPLDSINDKYRAYVFADRHGVDHPKTFGSYESIDHVDWANLPDTFVLKTRWGSSNHGVKALIREGSDTYHDLLRSSRCSVAEIVDDYLEMESKGTVSKAMFAEELILKHGMRQIADDWKFYCFDGVVGLCMQRDVRASGDLSQWRFKFWDRDWKDMGPIKYADRLDPDLVAPDDGAALVELAERISAIVGRPFLRIDLFESDRGPVLGEFTPRPGPPEVFTAEIDEMLGRMWEEAEQRLFAREIEDGRWDHILIE